MARAKPKKQSVDIKENKEMMNILNIRIKMEEQVLFKLGENFLFCSLYILYDMINIYYQKWVKYIMFRA